MSVLGDHDAKRSFCVQRLEFDTVSDPQKSPCPATFFDVVNPVGSPSEFAITNSRVRPRVNSATQQFRGWVAGRETGKPCRTGPDPEGSGSLGRTCGGQEGEHTCGTATRWRGSNRCSMGEITHHQVLHKTKLCNLTLPKHSDPPKRAQVLKQFLDVFCLFSRSLN